MRFKRIFLGLALFGFMLSSIAYGASKIAIMPFVINAPVGNEGNWSDIQHSLESNLQSREIDFVPASTINSKNIQNMNIATARTTAIKLNATHVVYGTYNQIGDSFSIDAHIVDIKTHKNTAVSVSRKNMNDLQSAGIELGRLISKNTASDVQKVEENVTNKVYDSENEPVKKVAPLKVGKGYVSDIIVKGSNSLSDEVAITRMKTKRGDLFSRENLNEDIKRLYDSGYYEDVEISAVDSSTGKIVTVTVQEKPYIIGIGVQGNKVYEKDDITEVMSTHINSVLNLQTLATDLDAIRQLYQKKGYYNANVTYKIDSVSDRNAQLIIMVTEGEKLYIKDIEIKGAKQVDKGELLSKLVLKKRGFLSWITGTGVLKKDMLDRDASALESYYADNGFINARVGQPEVTYEKDGIVIVFTVEEGERFKIGDIGFSGDLILGQDALLALTNMDEAKKNGMYFSQTMLHEDSLRISDYYAEHGHGFAETIPDLNVDVKKKVVNINFRVAQGREIHINQVLIVGNTRTRDNVIRREMRLADGDLFQASKLERSKVRLDKLGYFETVDIKAVPTSDPAKLDLIVKVKEKNTGKISAGAGFSTTDGAYFGVSVSEANLFGRGYTTSLSGQFGQKSNLYAFNFWNPHVYDTKWGMGLNLYRSEVEFTDYHRKSTGGRIRAAYPLGEYTTLILQYRLEKYHYYDIAANADRDIKERAGQNWASSVFTSISRDTTNNFFVPTAGTYNLASVEYAGGIVGGDDNFIRYILDSHVYYTPVGDLTFHVRGMVGFLSGDNVPHYERFFVGGLDTVRGYSSRSVGPYYPAIDGGDEKGGQSEFIFNSEILYPMSKQLGIFGLAFFDAGNTWEKGNAFAFDKLYQSVGAGIRWLSPLGPLRLEYGYPLDKVNGVKQHGRFEFSVGRGF